jgi:hypothetical protein
MPNLTRQQNLQPTEWFHNPQARIYATIVTQPSATWRLGNGNHKKRFNGSESRYLTGRLHKKEAAYTQLLASSQVRHGHNKEEQKSGFNRPPEISYSLFSAASNESQVFGLAQSH